MGTTKSALVTATYGADTFFGLDGADTFKGGWGNDNAIGGGGNDTLFGEQNDDTLMGGDGNDRLDGGSGKDTIFLDAGMDTVTGGAGDDMVTVFDSAGAKGDTVDGGTGVDTLYVMLGEENAAIKFTADDPLKTVKFNGLFDMKGVEKFNIMAGGGRDQITGYRLADMLDGGAGDDTLAGAAGDDFLQGGTGNDSLAGGQNNDIVLGGAGKDTIDGGTGNDVLYAGETSEDEGLEVDKVSGGTGDDLVGIGRGDTADGGTGTDTLHLDFSAGGVAESFTFAATNSFKGGGSAKNFEMLHFDGGSGGDKVTGGSLSDILNGGGGADALNGGRGDDVLDGEAGTDTLHGNDGNDVIEDSAGADKMYGDAGDDVFNTDDTNADKDVFDGGAGTDSVWFAEDADYSVYLDLGDQKKNDGLAKGDTFSLIEFFHGTAMDDVMLGASTKNDSFFGEDGDDVLNGRAGNDTLDGGAGSDELTGGAGKDVFVMTAPGDDDGDGGDIPGFALGSGDYWKGDIVTDFKQGEDKLQIGLAAFGLETAGDFVLTVGTSAKANGPEFIFDTATDRLWFDADGKGGDHAMQLLATFENGVTLKNTDFIFG